MWIRTSQAWAILAIAMVLGASACSSSSIGRGEKERDWTHPLRGGVRVSSVDVAAELVAFEIVEPSFGVGPDSVWVSDPQKTVDVRRRVVVFAYTLPDVGPALISEGLPKMDLAAMRVAADSPNAPADALTMVPVGRTQGLLSRGNGTAGIKWIKDGVQFDLLGRALTAVRAQELAALV